MAYLWVFYGIYFIIKLFIKKFIFERKKRNMTEEEKIYNGAKEVQALAKSLVVASKSKVNIRGKENIPKGSCVFVGNHQGNFDILVMRGYIDKPMGFIAKKELKKFPGVNYWMKQIHCVFLDREDPRDSVRAILEGVENLKKGISMAIYPEGTRSQSKEMLEFKKGAMKLALKAGVPIIPVTINGSYKIFEAQKGRKTKPARVDLVFSEPIDTKNLSKEEINNLSEHVKGIIESTLKDLNN
jgi:1-acyl-sn-glycerol-3-phosphate acyltransferase